MISCMIVDYSKVAKSDIDKSIVEMIQGERFQIHDYTNEKKIIFLEDVERIQVWQFVLNLEVCQIPVGYGFGSKKRKAKEEAVHRLNMILNMKNIKNLA